MFRNLLLLTTLIFSMSSFALNIPLLKEKVIENRTNLTEVQYDALEHLGAARISLVFDTNSSNKDTSTYIVPVKLDGLKFDSHLGDDGAIVYTKNHKQYICAYKNAGLFVSKKWEETGLCKIEVSMKWAFTHLSKGSSKVKRKLATATLIIAES